MFIIAWLLFLYTVPAISAPFNDQFAMALEAQKNQEYQDAFNMYCAIPIKTSNIMCNMALIAYHEKKYPQAIALWRAACELTVFFDGTRVIKHVSDAITQLKKEQGLSDFFAGHPADDTRMVYHILFLGVWFLNIMPLWFMQLLYVLLSILLISMVWGLLYKYISAKKGFLYMSFFGMLLLCTLYSIKIRTAAYGIVQEPAILRCGPGEFFEPVTEISPLVELLIEQKESSWYKVRYQDTVGWIPKKSLYCIDEHMPCAITIANLE